MKNINLEGKTVLVTGVAGFIGSNLCKNLLETIKDITVIGIDNMNDYYDVNLKYTRLEEISKYEKFYFIKGSIANKTIITDIFDNYKLV